MRWEISDIKKEWKSSPEEKSGPNRQLSQKDPSQQTSDQAKKHHVAPVSKKRKAMQILMSRSQQTSGQAEERHMTPTYKERRAMRSLMSESQQTSGQTEEHHVTSVSKKRKALRILNSQSQKTSDQAEEHHVAPNSKERSAMRSLITQSQPTSVHAEEHRVAPASKKRKAMRILMSQRQQISCQVEEHHVAHNLKERRAMQSLISQSQQSSGQAEEHHMVPDSKKRKAMRILISKLQQTSGQVEEHLAGPAPKERKTMRILILQSQQTSGQAEEHHGTPVSKKRKAMRILMSRSQQTLHPTEKQHVAPAPKERKIMQIWISKLQKTSGQAEEHDMASTSEKKKTMKFTNSQSQQTSGQAEEHCVAPTFEYTQGLRNQTALHPEEATSAVMENRSFHDCEFQNVQKMTRTVVSHFHKPKDKVFVDHKLQEPLFKNNVSFIVEKLQEMYTLGAHLGRGGFGLVYEGIRNTDGLPVAIKYVSKRKEKLIKLPLRKRRLPMEVALMRHVNSAPASPHVLNLIEWFDLPSHYVLVLERPQSSQDLHQFCTAQGGTLTEHQARIVMLQVIEALRLCQDRGVLHRDLKPQNLLIQPETLEVKLIDFGCAVFLKDAPCAKISGTKLYFPPEVFLWKQYLPSPATVWSFGVTLYTLLFGRLPFATVEDIIKCYFIIPVGISKECHSLIMRCLRPRATERPTLDQIVLHPWFH
ncbi:hypothetical protein Z043_102244 [Scleropages formosus]|uniref:non-specific serine/threonine protein kinase n=1 Tax=Scleropages formosus TaxID=113540 RepID=A0A0N8K2N9_SCLFO|nr:hypothetical protein Z043_102244 [Scleropages formosus]